MEHRSSRHSFAEPLPASILHLPPFLGAESTPTQFDDSVQTPLSPLHESFEDDFSDLNLKKPDDAALKFSSAEEPNKLNQNQLANSEKQYCFADCLGVSDCLSAMK
ncbi:hypothetical protein NDU88_007732 [Pleurodeles waltl]|uniref:Uncharacterized protein n=1 Tax=Pleurodeles waltl TaxID=8319 RepID=A0AAV7N681_PLEWA|nr:hypothetical protein NDU88_007732 [Pleurodeles waltl]